MSDLGPAFRNAMDWMGQEALEQDRVWTEGWRYGWLQRDVSEQFHRDMSAQFAAEVAKAELLTPTKTLTKTKSRRAK